MPKQYSIQEMQQQIAQLTDTMNLPGVPADEIAIYKNTIARIQAEIDAQKSGPKIPTPEPTPPVKHTTPPPAAPYQIPTSQGMDQALERDEHRTNQYRQQQAEKIIPVTKTAGRVVTTSPLPSGEGSGVGSTISARIIHAGNQTPVTSAGLPATIQAEHDTDPYNPRITITWPDGYTITVNETEARSRFTSTLRDTTALRLVQQGRFEAMWRWSSPWRAAGYYQALTALRGGQPPTLRDLGINRPNDLTKTVFEKITTKQ